MATLGAKGEMGPLTGRWGFGLCLKAVSRETSIPGRFHGQLPEEGSAFHVKHRGCGRPSQQARRLPSTSFPMRARSGTGRPTGSDSDRKRGDISTHAPRECRRDPYWCKRTERHPTKAVGANNPQRINTTPPVSRETGGGAIRQVVQVISPTKQDTSRVHRHGLYGTAVRGASSWQG